MGYSIYEDYVKSKEFTVKINDEEFILNSSTISEFEKYLERNLKESYIAVQLISHIEFLPVGGKDKAYFPHIKSPIKFYSQWSKLGLPYTIERLK